MCSLVMEPSFLGSVREDVQVAACVNEIRNREAELILSQKDVKLNRQNGNSFGFLQI